MFFRFRCSRRVFPPVVPGLRFRPDFRPAFPSGGAWFAERFRAPSAFGGLSVFAGVSALRPFSAFPSGISARRLGLCYRLLFPVCVSARHFPPAVLGLRSVSALRLPLRGLSVSACLFSACGYFRIRQKTRLPEPGRWLAALRRPPPVPCFRTAGGSVSGGIRAVRAAKLHIIP